MMRRRFLSLRRTAVWIQRKYRANVCAKHHLQQFRRLQKAAIKIQSWYRGWMVRKKMQEMQRAATLIQATYRMHRTQVTFQTWKHASVLIQQRYRAHTAAKLQREHYVRLRHSAVVIQAAQGNESKAAFQGEAQSCRNNTKHIQNVQAVLFLPKASVGYKSNTRKI